jgi:hypothetical protein
MRAGCPDIAGSLELPVRGDQQAIFDGHAGLRPERAVTLIAATILIGR